MTGRERVALGATPLRGSGLSEGNLMRRVVVLLTVLVLTMAVMAPAGARDGRFLTSLTCPRNRPGGNRRREWHRVLHWEL